MIMWYWAPDDAIFFPGEQRFSSETWDDVHWWTDGAGEDPLSVREYTKGMMPVPFKGDGRFCGRKEWFADGAPSDAPPIPRGAGGWPQCCFNRPLTGAYALAYSSAWDVIRET
jgi:hypothetical protein